MVAKSDLTFESDLSKSNLILKYKEMKNTFDDLLKLLRELENGYEISIGNAIQNIHSQNIANVESYTKGGKDYDRLDTQGITDERKEKTLQMFKQIKDDFEFAVYNTYIKNIEFLDKHNSSKYDEIAIDIKFKTIRDSFKAEDIYYDISLSLGLHLQHKDNDIRIYFSGSRDTGCSLKLDSLLFNGVSFVFYEDIRNKVDSILNVGRNEHVRLINTLEQLINFISYVKNDLLVRRTSIKID